MPPSGTFSMGHSVLLKFVYTITFFLKVSTVCALAVFGTQIGFALGFVVPSTVVKNHNDLKLVGADIQTLCLIIAIYMIPVSLAILFCKYRHRLTG